MSETLQVSQICPQLENLRLKKSFADLNIIGIDGTSVCAHKIVLAARWPNLEHTFKNTQNDELSWAKYPSSIIEAVVHFAYTGEIQLDVKNTMRVYLLALSVGSAALEKLCIDFFLPRITYENLEHTWSISLVTGSELLKSGCITVMRSHFEGFIDSNMFLKLDSVTLTFILKTLEFSERLEETKLQAITVWINQDRDRVVHLPELSTLIFQNKPTNSANHGIFLVVEDRKENEERLHIVQLDLDGGKVTSVGQLPFLRSPSVVMCASSIFCLGDCNYNGRVHQFDLVTRTARTPTQLTEPVCWTASAASSNELIVSGGVNESGQIVATCSVYAPETNSWMTLGKLQQAREAHRMCWFSDGRVFAIGGLYEDCLSSVEMLERQWIQTPKETASADWRNVASMKSGRFYFGCCIVEGRIVVAGGSTVDHNPSSSVESFEPPTSTNTGQWTSLTNLASAVLWCCLVPSAGELVLIDDGEMQLGRRKAQVASASEWDLWTWEPRPKLTSFSWCWGLVSLPSTDASQK